MRIHHVTVPARNPEHVARVLAEIFGGRVIPIPHPRDTRLVYADDGDGTVIEVWPAGMRIGAEGELDVTDQPLPEAWPHHAYLTSDHAEPDRVLAIFAREGWK